MFTGIIEEIGVIERIAYGTKSVSLRVKAHKVLEGTHVGDSISTNGVCLTVTTLDNSSFTADVMPETMNRSALGELKIGSPVNLERALQLSSRLGGHLVSGHIDGMARVSKRVADDNAIWLTIEANNKLLRYIIEKGSIAIDGVSLTVATVDDRSFQVSIIPHTQNETTLVHKPIGSMVNIENDMIAKYVEKWMKGDSSSSNITLDFLKENGF